MHGASRNFLVAFIDDVPTTAGILDSFFLSFMQLDHFFASKTNALFDAKNFCKDPQMIWHISPMLLYGFGVWFTLQLKSTKQIIIIYNQLLYIICFVDFLIDTDHVDDDDVVHDGILGGRRPGLDDSTEEILVPTRA